MGMERGAGLVPWRPAGELRGLVVEYRGFRDDDGGGAGQHPWREHPSAVVPLIIDCGAGWDVAAPGSAYRAARRIGGFVAGMHDAFAVIAPAGPAFGVQVDLDPLGARRLLGLPMHELTNRVVALEDVIGHASAELHERVATAGSWPERFAIVDAALTRRLRETPAASPGVAWAWHRLRQTDGAVPIGSLAADLGWTPKRLIARFRSEVGLAPKTAARVLRFRALHSRLRMRPADPPAPHWADLALECGYADQSHLVRDVRRMTGLTPTKLLVSLAPPRPRVHAPLA